MESKSNVGGGLRASESTACDVGSGSTAKPTVQGQPLSTGGTSQHFAEPAHTAGTATGQGKSSGSKLPADKEQLKQQASEKAGELKDAARQSADQVKQQAGEAAARLKEQGASVLGQQKDRLVDEVSHFSAAVRQAANKLHEEQDDNIASYADAAADQIDQVAQYLRDRDFSSLASDATQLARRRPELFAGGMFVAGLALARFLKASGQPRSDRDGSGRQLATAGSTGRPFPPSNIETGRTGAGLATTTGPTMASMPRTTGPQDAACPTPTGSGKTTGPSTTRLPR